MYQHRPHRAHRTCSGISRYVANLSSLCPTCSQSTSTIPAPTQPMIAMTNNSHAPNVLPPATNTNSHLSPTTPPSIPSHTIFIHLPSPQTQWTPCIATLNAQHAPTFTEESNQCIEQCD